jgi:protein tyrosine phosphatase (PTP) superfamily phosphohydrolase (DUF442 family)
LPVGIPQFALATDRVASGLEPLLDGFDWLSTNGYRTIVHLTQPGKDDTADRRQVESRGMKFVSLEVSPQTLSQSVVENFTRLVKDSASQPLFIYDRDGALAGGLWYLYFRSVEHLSDEDARARAGRLGLKEMQEGDQRLMWLAVQKYLSEHRQ